MIDETLVDLEPLVSTKVACRLVGRSRATLYRHRQGPKAGPPAPRPTPTDALSDDERHHRHLQPLVAWMVAPAESGELAEAFIADAVAAQGIVRDQLTIHADRGSSMTSKPVAQLLLDLGVARTHSRPHVSNDNPYSESNFKTLKYCPAFPGRFGSIEDARVFCAEFFNHYNHVHRHGGIGLHTAASVHYGTAPDIRSRRGEVLDAAYAANPGRFRHRRPAHRSCPPSPGSTNPPPKHSSTATKKLSQTA